MTNKAKIVSMKNVLDQGENKDVTNSSKETNDFIIGFDV